MDSTKRPLQIPPEFATYAEKHGIFEMYQRMLQNVLVNKPADPLSFLIDELKKENDDVPQVVILGPPASGKHTITKMVCGKLRTARLTPANLLEEAEGKDKEEALQCQKDKKPMPVDLWVRLIENRLKLFDCQKKGWVMEGFPKTREMAQAMQVKGIYPKHVILLDAPDTVLIERAAGKRIDPKTGDVYHTTFDWPATPSVAERLQAVPENEESVVVDNLVEHHRHRDAVLSCFRGTVKVVNADQPKADVFSQALTFLCGKARTAAPHTPRIVLLGPTGSGKGVQAALLANKYNIVNVSCGQLIKQAVADESKLGAACKPYVEKGMLVQDAVVLALLKERLSQLDCVSRGWVLHGYPRTREQAEQVNFAGFVPNRVFFLNVPNESVVERLTMRATDPITGDRYHLMYNPPRTQDVKDRLQVHTKDTDEEVKRRLSEYHTFGEELQDYYEDALFINGDQDPHTVFECIESMVVNPLPKRVH